MAIELEAKVKLDSHAGLRERLAAAGGQRCGAVLESNHIFDDANRSLFKADRGLRVRALRHEDGSQSATLTCKGPQLGGPFKSREELELTVGDAGTACAMLKMLGYTEVVSYQKRRESWHVRDCRVELDELPRLGSYVEIEGPDPQAIEAILAELSLKNQPLIRETYVALVVEHCRQAGLASCQLSF